MTLQLSEAAVPAVPVVHDGMRLLTTVVGAPDVTKSTKNVRCVCRVAADPSRLLIRNDSGTSGLRVRPRPDAEAPVTSLSP